MKTKLSTSTTVLLMSFSLFFSYTLKAQIIAAKDEKKAMDSTATDYIIKYKIKAITIHTYSSEDSTLANAKLASKDRSLYDRNGNRLENISENANGKIMETRKSRYDSKNNLLEYVVYDSMNKISLTEKRQYDNYDRQIEFTTYDSASKVTYSQQTRYDNSGREAETSTTMPLYTYTAKTEDADKNVTYTYKNRYDFNDNVVEYTTDSAGVTTNKTLSAYDNKNRLISSQSFDHNQLQSVVSYVYDKKGGSTQTIEYYTNANRTQCSPKKNRAVVKYDSKGYEISSVEISEDNGETSTTKSTNEYKFDGDKLISIKSTTETKSEGYNSKSVTSQTYKYDKNGNEIESVSKYGGGGSATYTTKTEYNKNNEITKQTVYNGTCMDKPASITLYTYYPDGKKLKEVSYESFDYPSKTIYRYDDRFIPVEQISISPRNASRYVYTYEYW